jgi:hypothetical protein
LSDTWWIEWDYRDKRNINNRNVSNLTLEFVNQTHASTSGSIYNATFFSAAVVPAVFDNSSLTVIGYAFLTDTLSPGEWRIRANYTNLFEQGGMTNITHLSEPFYIEGEGNCTGVVSADNTTLKSPSSVS